MAARKLQQEIDKTFKRVAEGVTTFESIYEKLQQSTNASQKDKLEDALKKEIKKLQRCRDQIKAWASMNDIKDKKPLLDQRKLIETQMEKFKAVEKEMKTKAYSKEGLSAAAKLDPKEKEKLEMCQFLSNMVEELERQIEHVEAETEAMNANVKKSKKDTGKADRISELERTAERHKWHQGKLETLLRILENGSIEVDRVKELEDSIKYYVENNQEVDFMEDDSIYDDLNLEDEEDAFGMNADGDRVSSQDTQSIQDEPPDTDTRPASVSQGKPKATSVPEAPVVVARRSSTQMKSPLPALATLHTSLPANANGTATLGMKPAPLPTIAPGQPLKYASAAAAAAASDKSGVGIAPLPPPPSAAHAASSNTATPPAPTPAALAKTSASVSPALVPSQPTTASPKPPQPPIAHVPKETPNQPPSKPVTPSLTRAAPAVVAPVSQPPVAEEPEPVAPQPVGTRAREDAPQSSSSEQVEETSKSQASIVKPARPISPDSGIALTNGDAAKDDSDDDAESIYHLPSELQDLFQSFQASRARVRSAQLSVDGRLLEASRANAPGPLDIEKPDHYMPQNPYAFTPDHYPKDPLPIFDDSRLYSRIDTDTLFYAFYYRQGTYQQYLAAKALKGQSWRFHKQYQTWFQRHEEPKTITEEYEQGTYRFFDYESTWMNRRKADFKFAYRFLEDDL
ncbi:general negative regulator of transcription subunit 5 [Elasticomyces elasticus]|nr:general negative regulator of transcription subunit 5 [Elasticomyces elasticus]